MATFSPSPRETTRLPQVGQDGQPLTRRQKRELERARQVADPHRAAPPAPGAPGQPRTPAGPAPLPPPTSNTPLIVGLVVGATVGDAVRETGIDLAATNAPLLAPGVGAQGAGEAELAHVFGAARAQVLASTSRGVLSAGPDRDALCGAAGRAASEAGRALRRQNDTPSNCGPHHLREGVARL